MYYASHMLVPLNTMKSSTKVNYTTNKGETFSTNILVVKEEVGIRMRPEAGERLSIRRVRQQSPGAAEHAEGQRPGLRPAARAGRPGAGLRARAAARRGRQGSARGAHAPRLAHAFQGYDLQVKRYF